MAPLDLQESEYAGIDFKKLEIRESLLQSREFTNCTFTNCNFNGTQFQHCRFRDCYLKGCDLSLVRLEGCTFANVRFEDSKLIGMDWTRSDWGSGKRLFKPADFFNCVLNFSSFMALNMEKVSICKCIAHEVSLEDANLSFADCSGSDFASSRFLHTNLTGADFRGAVNYQISPTLNTLKKTKFSLPEAMSLLHNLDIVLEE